MREYKFQSIYYSGNTVIWKRSYLKLENALSMALKVLVVEGGLKDVIEVHKKESGKIYGAVRKSGKNSAKVDWDWGK